MRTRPNGEQLTIALVAHDNTKWQLLAWADRNKHELRQYRLVATGTTGRLLHNDLGLDVERMASGPLGGDLQLGARIVEGQVDALVYFWDPLEPQPHDPDIRSLLRVATLRDVPTASNPSTADMVLAGLAVLRRAQTPAVQSVS
jgi:methylglyoxal synthase